VAFVLTTKQAAERLGISESRIRQYIAAGKLKATAFGRSHQITERDLAKFKRPAMGRPRKLTA
jgi:excisionase family DNA binding protein